VKIGKDIALAVKTINEGGVIVYPTETVYGIGCLATDEKAIRRVYEIKKRPLSMPLSIAVSSLEMMETVAKIEAEDFIKKFLPGPVTVILKRKKVLPDILTAGSKYVGIRYPENQMAIDLIRQTGPIVSTSANHHGEKDPVSLEDIKIDVDYILDGGRTKYGGPSTIVDLHEYEVVRKGVNYERVRAYMYGCGRGTED
jgi:L-threonylcarbamoyladenylate synthase